MLYTLAASNNMTLVGDDRLKSDLPERAFITTLSLHHSLHVLRAKSFSIVEL